MTRPTAAACTVDTHMGELRCPGRDEQNLRRRSIPSSFDHVDISSSSKVERPRWSIGGSGVSGRGVPDFVRVSRHHDAVLRCVEDGRKRSRRRQSSDLTTFPPKRISQECGTSSVWNCAGLTWNGLRRRFSVLRRSSRMPPRRRDCQLPVDTGNRLRFRKIQCGILNISALVFKAFTE